MSEIVSYQIKQQSAWLTLNRPERLNALSIPLIDELIAALQRAAADSEARVVVITGSGTRAFCAGADIDSFYNESQGTVDEHAFRDRLLQLFELLMDLSKPTIARVNGYALGGGFGLAMACDLVVASSTALFGTPEINIGLFPMMIMPVLYRNVGRKKLLEMMFTGDKISGEEALQLGMVNAAVSVDQLDQSVQELANKLAAKSGMTLKLGRQAFYHMADLPVREALPYLQGMLSQNLHTQDGREGLQAFLEKRPPQWQDA
ncbi:MAG: enoyl-CoA hydratase/isomerase family protein [Candidatus Sericytochromatia bacterium]|nr:enoyl-CoA hydratase/isomerase family protein [Candidatus Sericytochromatia bacterium]